MSHRPSENHRYPIDKINPFIPIIDPMPGEYWKELTEKEVPGILPYYAISNFGRVVHIYENKYMSLSWDGPGYVTVVLRTIKGSKTYRVHRLVMLTFRYFDGCEKLFVDHDNGDRRQNWIDLPVFNPSTGQYELKDNLKWCTRSENLQFRYNNPAQINFANMLRDAEHQIKEKTVREICDLLQEGYTVTDVVKKTNTTYNIVEFIKLGYVWKDISKNYEFPDKPTISSRVRKITEDQVKIICEMLEQDKSLKEILKAANLSYEQRHYVYSIKKHETYTDISKNYNI